MMTLGLTYRWQFYHSCCVYSSELYRLGVYHVCLDCQGMLYHAPLLILFLGFDWRSDSYQRCSGWWNIWEREREREQVTGVEAWPGRPTEPSLWPHIGQQCSGEPHQPQRFAMCFTASPQPILSKLKGTHSFASAWFLIPSASGASGVPFSNQMWLAGY